MRAQPKSPRPISRPTATRTGSANPGRIVGCGVFLAALLWTGVPAAAQEVQLSVSSEEIYAELPFVLSVSVKGFEETPEPTADAPDIPGCSVAFLGLQPNVSSYIGIVNGQRTESRSVTFVFRYRVTASAPGRYQIPVVTIRQGTRQARGKPASFDAREVTATPDMKLLVTLPDRAVWVGETFPVRIDWYLRRDVHEQTFVVPLFEQEEHVNVEAPPNADPRRTLEFPAGARDLRLPYDREDATLDGKDYVRFRFEALATAARTGSLDLPPARVLARIRTGEGRDRFGFPVARTGLFKAEDRPLHLQVRPLPDADRPPTFRGAVGTGFAIDVRADRTVVRVGDPVDLEIVLHGRGRMEGLSLPPLDTAGLPPETFSAPAGAPAGERMEDGGKKFHVTVRIRSEAAREIPPLAFAYFDPDLGAYQVAHSRPIALSVEGSALVGADEVITSRPATTESPTDERPPTAAPASGVFAGADLALSPPAQTLLSAPSVRGAIPWIVLLYGAPILIVAGRGWLRRTAPRRAADRDRRVAAHSCLRVAREVAAIPAREAAPRIVSALRHLRRCTEAPGDPATDALLVRIEAAGFDPLASEEPLPSGLLDEVRSATRQGTPASGKWAGILLAVALFGAPWLYAGADDIDAADLGAARAAYREGMEAADRNRRVAAFDRAGRTFEEILRRHPDCPDLLADRGNAALGAQDLGAAVLAFRRALACDPSHARARRNLEVTRRRLPSWLPAPERTDALGAFFSWHERFSLRRKLLFGAAAFALALLLTLPWARLPPWVRHTAYLPGLAWIALTASAILTSGPDRGAVVQQDGAVLRAADSTGAPTVFPHPLPAGAEVTVRESRQGWSRIELPGGSQGWLPSTAVENIVREAP